MDVVKVESGDPLGNAAEAGNVELVKKLLKGRGKLKVHATLLGEHHEALGKSQKRDLQATQSQDLSMYTWGIQ